jgi:hypothetical protein
MEFDGAAFTGGVGAVPLEDPKMRDDWQRDTLYRLRLVQQGRELSGRITLKFTKEAVRAP